MKSTALFACSILLAALLLGLATAARADVAPPPPPAGANLFPGVETTQVRMLSETVMINVVKTEPGETSYAHVRAQFQMRNLGEQAEDLQVRFPLNFLVDYMGDWQACEFPLAYPEIADFTAQVDEQPAAITTTTRQIADPGGARGEVQVNCWASFPVTFTPGMDVNIEVRYTVQGAPGLYGMSNNLEYTYMLVSGKAWKDTIGSAEIILTAPYSLTDKTLLGYQPQGAVVNGSEIRWRFENFEPDANITAGLMDPGHWALINNQVKAVTDNPQDGEAWARLARAYRDAVISKPVGFHGGLGGFEYYGQSLTAFAKAVGLRPADADLRIDYAELLIHNAFTPFAGDSAAVYDSLVLAVEQLQRAIKIQPNHPRAYLLMKDLESWPNAPRKLVDLSGAQPNFLILTPGGPTTTPVPSLTRTPFPASLTPTATWTRNPTRTPTRTATATVTAPARTFTPLVIAEVQQAATEAPAQPGPRPSPLCGAALLPVLSLLAWAALRK